MSIILRFFPNGEFTQGVDTSQSRKNKHQAKSPIKPSPLAQECRDGYLQWVTENNNAHIHLCVPGTQFRTLDGGVYTYLCEDTQGHHYAYECEHYVLSDVLMNEPIGRMVARGELTPLVYQSVESSPQPEKPSRKRLESMTKNMSRNIRNAVYLLEQDYGKDLLSFLTLTLPNLSTDELGMCCERWDYMTDQLLKSLRKKLLAKEVELEYVYCTEIQVKRATIKGEYAPHLHIVFKGRNGKKQPWAITPKQIRKTWASIIANVVGHRQFNQTALENIQRIKYSAARYLSKYLSKSTRGYTNLDEHETHQKLRTQWGGMARHLAKRLKRSTIRLNSSGNHSELAISIFRAIPWLLECGLINYFAVGYISMGVSQSTGMERFLKVGSGCLSTPTYQGGLTRIIESIGLL